MKGIELTVAEALYDAYSRSRPGLVRSIESLVASGERKWRIMEAIRRASIRSAGGWKVDNDLEQVVDFIIAREKVAG